jgi:sulfide:quinone oxidoreductase
MTSQARVVIVGAGPGGVAAAQRLRGRSGEHVEVMLIEREGVAEYLPGTIPTLLGETSPEIWHQRVALRDVEVRAGEVEEVSGEGVRLGERWIGADAVIAAPGLSLDVGRVPDVSRACAFWDPRGAATAAEAVRRLRQGIVAVVISSLPYRCPPAPYGMAMQLAEHYREKNHSVGVVLITPEEEPLASLGGGIPEFLKYSCAKARVELLTDFHLDLASLGDRELHSTEGESVSYNLALVVPPHVRSALLAGLPDQGPLVEVSSDFESAEPGLFVVGDAAQVPLPRAADAALAEGRMAVDAVLERLGLSSEQESHLPKPECYVGHGRGFYSRISLRYPGGLPPAGEAEVAIEGPSAGLAAGFEEAFNRWRAMRSED